jgi:hypothetical protein
LGVRHWRLWNAQGTTPALKFVVGDLPEIVEQEIDGDAVPVEVRLPVTINGRIFPREDVDVWAFPARRGQTISCEVNAARLGSPLDSRLEVLDPGGRRIAENDDTFGADSFVRFTAPADGTYQVRIHDVNFRGGQAYVYRLTLTADPHVDRAYPLGGRRGSKVPFALTGQGLPAGPVTIDLPADAPADYAHRLTVNGKLTNSFPLDLDDLPEHRKAEANHPARAEPVSVPAVLNGRIGRPGEVDSWAVTARKGIAYEFDLRAARLGSPLDGVLTVLDAGKELARAEAGPGPGDPLLRFTAPADGTYVVRVQDRFPSRGGPDFAYRLRVTGPAVPDFRLRLAADALALDRGGQARLKVLADRLGGFAEPIGLTLDGLPPGVTATMTTIAARQSAVDVVLKAEATAPVRAGRVTVRGTAKVGDRTVTRTAVLPGPRGVPELDTVLLAVTVPTPFKIVGEYDMRWAARGTVHHRRYRLDRGGFEGPLQVSLADRQARHLQGVTGPTITVPAGATEFDYHVHLPPWMETGRTCRVVVMATGVIKDGGSEHVVSFSTPNQNEQVIAVIEPGQLGVEVDRPAVRAAPGRSVALPVRVTRGKSLQGPVKLELIVAEHLHGVTADPVVVPADKGAAEVAVRFAADVHGPFNLPVVIRATATDKGEPVVGEVKVEILP